MKTEKTPDTGETGAFCREISSHHPRNAGYASTKQEILFNLI